MILITDLRHAGRTGASRAADGAVAAAARVPIQTWLAERVATDEDLRLFLEALGAQPASQELLVDLFRIVLATVVLRLDVGAPDR